MQNVALEMRIAEVVEAEDHPVRLLPRPALQEVIKRDLPEVDAADELVVAAQRGVRNPGRGQAVEDQGVDEVAARDGRGRQQL